jgi:hypothetical protein
MKTKFNLIISFSKIFSILLLASGTCVSLYLKSESVFITTIIASTGLLTNKQYQDRIKALKQNLTDEKQ